MKIYFFKKNIAYVQKAVLDKNACAFWYNNGLVSYKGLEELIKIEEIWLEENIYDSFEKDYKELVERFPVIVFPSIKETTTITPKKICYFASNDTHVFLFKNILEKSKNGYDLQCSAIESAKKAAMSIGVKAVEIKDKIYNEEDYSLLILGNDWGPLEQHINNDFQQIQKNTICIQESVIDFNLQDQRMLQCSIPIFQGIVTLKNVNLNQKICAVIGNPRYEDLKPVYLPKEDKVLINVNFTYGIYENIRQEWVDDIVDLCSEKNLAYQISQHPRDNGNFSQYNLIKTNASNVHAAISESTILVTRFSSLIHESLCMGRSVIYYNPHGEKLFYDFEADDRCLYMAKTKQELSEALNIILNNSTKKELSSNIIAYLNRHVGMATQSKASDYISQLIEFATCFPALKSGISLFRLKHTAQTIQQKVFRKARKILNI